MSTYSSNSNYIIEQCGADITNLFAVDMKPIQISANRKSTTLAAGLKKLFLPKGYPQSVSPDYLPYQIWDTIQAFASSITGALASQAILTGVGVGDSSSTVLAASFSWMLKDGTGMIGRIVFAGWKGCHLDADCKFWRFMADILNDIAICLELLSPMSFSFTFVVSVANLLKCLVSVAGNGTRAAIAQHQAIMDNLADVSAKDASQETLSNLLAWCLNFCLLYYVIGHPIIIWSSYILFTIVHLYANYEAVKCLQFNTFNRARFHIAIQQWFTNELNLDIISLHKGFPSVQWVNLNEPILWEMDQPRVYLGYSLTALPMEDQLSISMFIPLLEKHRYILYCPQWQRIQTGSASRCFEVYIFLNTVSSHLDQLKAMLHVELLHYMNRHLWKFLEQEALVNNVFDFTKYTMKLVDKLFDQLLLAINSQPSYKAKWTVDTLHFAASEWRICA